MSVPVGVGGIVAVAVLVGTAVVVGRSDGVVETVAVDDGFGVQVGIGDGVRMTAAATARSVTMGTWAVGMSVGVGCGAQPDMNARIGNSQRNTRTAQLTLDTQKNRPY